ncbi:MAG TPA: hypothetical protein VE505_14535 [Vicinamibacterales bacterium]|nr:hypothetical protein [Vicinamibacterales bacterium]
MDGVWPALALASPLRELRERWPRHARRLPLVVRPRVARREGGVIEQTIGFPAALAFVEYQHWRPALLVVVLCERALDAEAERCYSREGAARQRSILHHYFRRAR